VIHRVVATALAADLDPIVVVVRNDARAVRSSLQGLPVRFAAEYYGSVVRPDTLGNTHDMRFMVIPAVPAGLIPFL